MNKGICFKIDRALSSQVRSYLASLESRYIDIKYWQLGTMGDRTFILYGDKFNILIVKAYIQKWRECPIGLIGYKHRDD